MSLTWGTILPHGAANEFYDAGAADGWARLRDTAVAFDELGYDHLWISDHLMASGIDRTSPHFECYSTLSAVSQLTRRARLGAIVTCALYRSVAILAKQAAGVDVMSGGRLIFALGAGWDEQEFTAYGYPFPSPADRITAFGETLEAVLRLWSEPTVDYDGRFVRLKGASCSPRPAERPPVWTGTHGPRGLRTTARHADVANWNVGLAEFRRLSSLLVTACAEVGRDAATIATSVFRLADLSGTDEHVRRLLDRQGAPADLAGALADDHFIGTVDEVVGKVQAFVDAGARHIITLFLDSETTNESAERFIREVIPAIH